MKSHYRFFVYNQHAGRTNPDGFFPSVKSSHKIAFWLFGFLLMNISAAFSQSTQTPQMPMQALRENSLETSWLNKEVYKSLLLDNMEDLETWSKSGAGEMSLTDERAKRVKISYNGKNKEAVFMPGKVYTLDTGDKLSYSLSYETTDQGLIRFTVKAEGTGNIHFELRGWNLELNEKVQDTGTLDGKTINLVWEASLIDLEKPWVAVSVPDGKISQMKEVNNIKMGK